MIAALSAYGHVLVGYVASGAALAWFSWRVIARGRKLARQVPDEDKPWL
ncbi:MAG: hypothetical protein JWL70_1845 [Acidimicrobiia bacterium]|nr:hypothetical protein [Acidimicrobiia bacterium]